mmetsp:Transcript_104770/g.202940  ORF Transcript_104770/g.202940 Transcript_104770/m.202940 type:complete len:211 (-) Transcript_104770:13-645(-)
MIQCEQLQTLHVDKHRISTPPSLLFEPLPAVMLCEVGNGRVPSVFALGQGVKELCAIIQGQGYARDRNRVGHPVDEGSTTPNLDDTSSAFCVGLFYQRPVRSGTRFKFLDHNYCSSDDVTICNAVPWKSHNPDTLNICEAVGTRLKGSIKAPLLAIWEANAELRPAWPARAEVAGRAKATCVAFALKRARPSRWPSTQTKPEPWLRAYTD